MSVRRDSSVPRGPARRPVAKAVGKADISTSVDEWFEQVTRLMVQPKPGSQPERPALHLAHADVDAELAKLRADMQKAFDEALETPLP